MNDIWKPLRHDRGYLLNIVTEAIRLYGTETPENLSLMGTLIDYLTWLTKDALQDEGEARRLAINYSKLAADLHSVEVFHRTHHQEHAAQAFFAGVLCGLEDMLCLLFGVDLLENKPISRDAFLVEWERVRRKLGL